MPKSPRTPSVVNHAEKAKTCAICGRPREPRYDPFCSKRCADVDLHRWLKGRYVIPGAEPVAREDDDEA